MTPPQRGDRAPEPCGLQVIGHSDLDRCGDGTQILRHRNALYAGHTGPSGMGTNP